MLSFKFSSYNNALGYFTLRAACSTVPHSTLKTMSRLQVLQIIMTFFQSITPSPHAHPTGVPVTLPRSVVDCHSDMSLA